MRQAVGEGRIERERSLGEVMSFDLVIRGGTLADGTGGELREQDVAIENGRIVEVGRGLGRGREECNARGLLVTPGFVDIHTHYDGQATWGDQLVPSSEHGVTTVVMGNCGVGLAPCRPQDRQALVRLMEGVEDLPEVVLTTGVPWAWESFGDYLDFLGGRSFDIDVAAQLPHAALRVNVMGGRALAHEPATEHDREMMAQVTLEAMRSGALGFSTSRSINHRASDGNPTPSLTATEAELTAIAQAVGRSGVGVLQMISDFSDPDREMAMLGRVIRAGARPTSISLMQVHDAPDRWRDILGWIGDLNREGQQVRGQVSGRLIGALLGFESSMNPFARRPTYMALASFAFEARVAELRKPDVRRRILSEGSLTADPPVTPLLSQFEMMYPLGESLDYEPAPEHFVGAIARARGVAAEEVAYDLMLERGGHAMLVIPATNYAHGSLEVCAEMMRSEYTVPGLGDGGAHVGFLCDASLSTHMLSYWTRDRTRGGRVALPEAVRRLARDTSRAVGMYDRGVIAPGFKADLNVLDYERLDLATPYVAYDLPSAGRRVRQGARGYVATIVSGQVIARDGVATSARPGRLVRSGRLRALGPSPRKIGTVRTRTMQ